MIKSFNFSLCLLGVFLIVGCSSDNSSSPEEPEIIDNNAPDVEISGLGDFLEVKTSLAVTIKDESNTTTRITLNGQELQNTSQKQFNLDLNPYPQEVGPATLRIVSEDEFGNRYQEDLSIEIRHLIMKFSLGQDEYISGDRYWVIFHNNDGSTFAFEEVFEGNASIYTDENLSSDKVFYTLVQYRTYNDDIFDQLTNSTYLVELGSERKPRSFASPDLSNYLEIQIERTELVNSYDKYRLNGFNYRRTYTESTSAPSYDEIHGISYAYPELLFIKTAMENGGQTFDGRKENYLYYELNPQLTDTEIRIFEADFKSMDAHFQVNLPPHDANTLRMYREGYENESDFEQEIRHIIYEVNTTDLATIPDYFDLPVLPSFAYYANITNYDLNGNAVYIKQFGNNLDWSAPKWGQPNWLGINENRYSFETDFQDVDYYLLQSTKIGNTGNLVKRFVWNIRTFDNSTINKSAPVMEFPSEITEAIGDTFYTTNEIVPKTITAVNFENINSFAESQAYLGLGTLQLSKMNEGIKSIIYDISDPSGRAPASEAKAPDLYW